MTPIPTLQIFDPSHVQSPDHPPHSQAPARFPLEIFHLIISKAKPSQLPTLIRISKSFYDFTSPLLYQTVVVGVYEDVGDEQILVAESGEKPCARSLHYESEIGMEGVVFIPINKLSCIPSSILPDRFTYVTRLAINSHYPDPCTGQTPIAMPNLDTLQILTDADAGGCQPLDGCARPGDLAYPEPLTLLLHPSCPLLLNLRPRRVILGGTETGFWGDGAGLWTSQSLFPPPWVKELVIFLGDLEDTGERSFVDGLPSTVELLTLVFEPREPDLMWVQSDDHIVVQDDEQDAAHKLWCTMVRMGAGNAQAFEIVGIESVDEDWVGEPVQTWGAKIRNEVVFMFKKNGLSQDEADRKADDIVFTEREVWDERERKRRPGSHRN